LANLLNVISECHFKNEPQLERTRRLLPEENSLLGTSFVDIDFDIENEPFAFFFENRRKPNLDSSKNGTQDLKEKQLNIELSVDMMNQVRCRKVILLAEFACAQKQGVVTCEGGLWSANRLLTVENQEEITQTTKQLAAMYCHNNYPYASNSQSLCPPNIEIWTRSATDLVSTRDRSQSYVGTRMRSNPSNSPDAYQHKVCPPHWSHSSLPSLTLSPNPMDMGSGPIPNIEYR